MLRKVDCPVCQAGVPIEDETPGKKYVCPFCRTTFSLPPRARRAEAGQDGKDDPDPEQR